MFRRDVFVVGAVRTAIGSFGGALKNVPLTDLATTAVSELLRRSSLPAEKVEHVVMGNVIPTEPGDAYLGRVASLQAGIPKEVPAFNGIDEPSALPPFLSALGLAPRRRRSGGLYARHSARSNRTDPYGYYGRECRRTVRDLARDAG